MTRKRVPQVRDGVRIAAAIAAGLLIIWGSVVLCQLLLIR